MVLFGMDGGKIFLCFVYDEFVLFKIFMDLVSMICWMNVCCFFMFFELFFVWKGKQGWEVIKEVGVMVCLVGVVIVFGDSFCFVWLKLFYCDDYFVVVWFMILFILLLGGVVMGDVVFLLI